MWSRLVSAAALAALLLAACGDDDGAPAGAPDAATAGDGGPALDLGAPDAGEGDSAPDGELDGATGTDATLDAAAAEDAALADAGPADAAVELDAGPGPDGGSSGVGVIRGSCGELDDTELLSAEPFYFRNAIDFPMGFTSMDELLLSAGAQEILAEGTAGGSSGLSEAFAFEVLHRCEGAELVKTETEIVYDPIGSDKTDILVTIDGHPIGVSVTRAVGFPFDAPYLVDRAQMLLERKLLSIQESTMNVVAGDAWLKQILHVIAYAPMHADSIRSAWDLIDPAIRGDTILYVTVTDGDDMFLY